MVGAGSQPTMQRPDGWLCPDVLTDELMIRVQRWLDEIKLDAETPDLWADLQRAGKLAIASDDSVENTPFTPAEREEIAEHMKELKDYVSHTHSLSAVQTQLLGEQLDSLVDASPRVGRKDWRLLAAGVMFTCLIDSAIPPETARAIFLLVVRGVEQIVLGAHLGLPGV